MTLSDVSDYQSLCSAAQRCWQQSMAILVYPSSSSGIHTQTRMVVVSPGLYEVSRKTWVILYSNRGLALTTFQCHSFQNPLMFTDFRGQLNCLACLRKWSWQHVQCTKQIVWHNWGLLMWSFYKLKWLPVANRSALLTFHNFKTCCSCVCCYRNGHRTMLFM